MSEQRSNRVYKSLHRPLTYMGIERKLFVMGMMGTMATFNATKSFLATAIVFAGSAGFGYWATKKDIAFLTITLKADRFKARYDAAKHQVSNVEIR